MTSRLISKQGLFTANLKIKVIPLILITIALILITLWKQWILKIWISRKYLKFSLKKYSKKLHIILKSSRNNISKKEGLIGKQKLFEAKMSSISKLFQKLISKNSKSLMRCFRKNFRELISQTFKIFFSPKN